HDTGGKFYDARGGQPVPPDDQIMADLVDQVSGIKVLPWTEAIRGGRIHWLDERPHQGYIDLCRRQALAPPPRKGELKVVFTPLHGVGSTTAMEGLVQQGFSVMPVAEQMEPNGQFPNVTKTPNPEVPESMDRALSLAQAQNADLVLATDPDADRLGGMVPKVRSQESGIRGQKSDARDQKSEVRSQRSGENWRFLNGNTLAALVTHFKLQGISAAGRLPNNPIVIKSLVTTSLITRIAHSFGAQVVENLLVGFKYIAEVLWQLEQNGVYEDIRGTPED